MMNSATCFLSLSPSSFKPSASTAINHNSFLGRSSTSPLRLQSYRFPHTCPCYSSPTKNDTVIQRSCVRITATASNNAPNSVAAILLAGGTGSRMKADRPKQFLMLRGKTVLEHSIILFGKMPEIKQLVIVLASEYRDQFLSLTRTLPCKVTFAEPGHSRQDSVYNGLAEVSESMTLACVHDAARPLVTQANIRDVLRDAAEHGAAVLGVPSKATIKESEDGQFVLRTIPRKRLWEIQTPQVIELQLLRRGFERAISKNVSVTDDVSVVELLGEPVKITMGEYTNIKLTTPEDMDIAESILEQRQEAEATKPV